MNRIRFAYGGLFVEKFIRFIYTMSKPSYYNCFTKGIWFILFLSTLIEEFEYSKLYNSQAAMCILKSNFSGPLSTTAEITTHPAMTYTTTETTSNLISTTAERTTTHATTETTKPTLTSTSTQTRSYSSTFYDQSSSLLTSTSTGIN